MSEVKLNTYVRKKDSGWQYIIRYKDVNGKWKTAFSKQGFKDKPEATKAMAMKMDEAEKIAKGSLKTGKVLFKDFFQKYIEEIKLYREYNTIIKFNSALFALKPIHNKEISKITNKDIQKCVNEWTLKYKDGTVKCYLASTKVIFKAAIKDNLITETPVIDIEVKKNKNTNIKKALSVSESEQLLKDFEGNKYYLFIYIALKTGMRLGEIMGLCWEDIDFENNKITINKQWKRVDGKYDFGSLKTENSNRIIDLPNSLKLVLEPLKDKGRILPFRSTRCLSDQLNVELRKYGVTIHELRHTYATTLLAAGLDYRSVADLMGHTVTVCMNTYSHVTDEMKKRRASLINSIL